MKTIALIGTCDTKNEELMLVRDKLKEAEVDCVLLDVSTKPGHVSEADFTPAQIYAAGGFDIREIQAKKKFEMLSAMAEGAAALVDRLYQEASFQVEAWRCRSRL